MTTMTNRIAIAIEDIVIERIAHFYRLGKIAEAHEAITEGERLATAHYAHMGKVLTPVLDGKHDD